MSDGIVRLVCTDRGSYGSRELATLHVRGDDPELLAAFRAHPEIGEAAASWLHACEQLGSVTQRAARRGDTVTCMWVEGGVTEVGEDALWTFSCPTCMRNVRRRQEWVQQLADRALDNTPTASVTINLSYLPC